MIQLTFEIIKNNKLPRGKIVLNGNVLHNNFYDFTTFDIKPKVGSNVLEITLDNKIENFGARKHCFTDWYSNCRYKKVSKNPSIKKHNKTNRVSKRNEK